MPRKIAFLLATAAGLFGWVAGASAATCINGAATICNGYGGSALSTYAESASGGTGNPDKYFSSNSQYWGANVGGPTPYSTTQLIASYSQSGGLGTVTLVFNTQFPTAGFSNGIQSSGGFSVDAADLFIQSNAVSSGIASSFNYGVSLGATKTGDGGINAGLYSMTSPCTVGASGSATGSCETSNQIWGSGTTKANATGASYGGAFGTAGSVSPSSGTCVNLAAGDCEASPTVLTGGASIANGGGTNLTETGVFSTTADTLTVTVIADNAAGQSLLSQIFSDFDIFWGTGDCGNAPIYGEISLDIPGAVPEPSSLALLASAAFGFEYLRRRRRRGSAIA